MKNACTVLILAMGLGSFFGFTNNKRAFQPNAAAYNHSNFIGPDTVPRKKDSVKSRSKTTPYDSFGKPKKMDSARLK